MANAIEFFIRLRRKGGIAIKKIKLINDGLWWGRSF